MWVGIATSRRLHSLAIRAVVDTFGHGPIYIDNASQPLSAQTQARTRRERLSTDQNGSTSVRSTERIAEELHPVHQPAGVEENLEGDYFDELRSPEIIMNDDLCINDYDLDMSNEADELAIIAAGGRCAPFARASSTHQPGTERKDNEKGGAVFEFTTAVEVSMELEPNAVFIETSDAKRTDNRHAVEWRAMQAICMVHVEHYTTGPGRQYVRGYCWKAYATEAALCHCYEVGAYRSAHGDDGGRRCRTV